MSRLSVILLMSIIYFCPPSSAVKCYSTNGLWTNENVLEGLCEAKYCWHAYNMRGDEIKIAFKHCADKSIWSSAGDFHGCIGRRTDGAMMAYDCQCRDRDFCNGNFSKELLTVMASYSSLNTFERITVPLPLLASLESQQTATKMTSVSIETASANPVCSRRGKSICQCDKGYSGSSCETGNCFTVIFMFQRVTQAYQIPEADGSEWQLIKRCSFNSSNCDANFICMPDDLVCLSSGKSCQNPIGWCLPISVDIWRLLKP